MHPPRRADEEILDLARWDLKVKVKDLLTVDNISIEVLIEKKWEWWLSTIINSATTRGKAL